MIINPIIRLKHLSILHSHPSSKLKNTQNSMKREEAGLFFWVAFKKCSKTVKGFAKFSIVRSVQVVQ